MADKPKLDKKPKPEDIETVPDAWERFEHAVDAAVSSGPKHRSSHKSSATGAPEKGKRSKPKQGKPH